MEVICIFVMLYWEPLVLLWVYLVLGVVSGLYVFFVGLMDLATVIRF